MTTPKKLDVKGVAATESLAVLALQFKYLFITARPKQWYKNLLLFIALIFSFNEHWNLQDIGHARDLLSITIAAFLIFCCLSIATYLINDIVDLTADRQHPKKKDRPLASGKLNLKLTCSVAILLALVALPLSYWLGLATGAGPGFGILATLYFLFTLSYSLFLRHVVILDVFIIGSGFVLRVIAGSVILSFPISPWLYICTMLLALFLALTKRRHEINLLLGNSGNHRKTLSEYTPKLIDEMIALITAATLISYSLYTFSAENLPDNHAMMITIPIVLYGIFRYLYLIHIKGAGGNLEEMLVKDKSLVITIALWIVSVVLILYLF